jgi:hypothetical protein
MLQKVEMIFQYEFHVAFLRVRFNRMEVGLLHNRVLIPIRHFYVSLVQRQRSRKLADLADTLKDTQKSFAGVTV